MKDGNNIEYVYAADGTRLKATHNTKLSAGRYASRDRYYRGNLLFTRSNDKLPYTVLVPGGYYFYESADDAFFLSLYVQDYQGNNRVELYEGNSVCQQTHYYPFGGIIGDLSSSSSFNAGNDFKYSGKELDRNFGLDMYDFHARQYDMAVPTFDRPDPMAHKFYWASPYSYCLGNPVNCVDKDGEKTVVIMPNDNFHIALLIQNEQGKYGYYSINGKDYGGLGHCEYDNLGQKNFDSVDEFKNSYYNSSNSTDETVEKDLQNGYNYSIFYELNTTPEQDAEIAAKFTEMSENKQYDLIPGAVRSNSVNCATTVNESLKAGNVNTGVSFGLEKITPALLMNSIQKANPSPQGTQLGNKTFIQKHIDPKINYLQTKMHSIENRIQNISNKLKNL